MATWDDVERIALGLPGTSERTGGQLGARQWRVKDTLFTWERPLGRTDLEALGAAAPEGPVLAARVPDEGAKQALVADDPVVYFTIPHFDGYPAVLVRLELIDPAELEELLVEAWLCRAPRRMAAAWLEARG